MPDGECEKIEPVLKLLFCGVVFFTAVLIGVEWGFPSDGQVFQTVAGVLTGLTGALLGRIKPPAQTPAASVQTPDTPKGKE